MVDIVNDNVDVPLDYEEVLCSSSSSSSSQSSTFQATLHANNHKHDKKRRRTRKPLLPHEVCPTCNESKRHQECSLRLCKYCCCESTERCTLTDHNRSKVGARKPFANITNTSSNEVIPCSPQSLMLLRGWRKP